MFLPQTSSNNVQEIIEGKVEKRTKGTCIYVYHVHVHAHTYMYNPHIRSTHIFRHTYSVHHTYICIYVCTCNSKKIEGSCFKQKSTTSTIEFSNSPHMSYCVLTYMYVCTYVCRCVCTSGRQEATHLPGRSEHAS